jgi:hypothetical protein
MTISHAKGPSTLWSSWSCHNLVIEWYQSWFPHPAYVLVFVKELGPIDDQVQKVQAIYDRSVLIRSLGLRGINDGATPAHSCPMPVCLIRYTDRGQLTGAVLLAIGCATRSTAVSDTTRGVTLPPHFGPSSSIPLGLIDGWPLRPFSRAISSRRASTICFSSDTLQAVPRTELPARRARGRKD